MIERYSRNEMRKIWSQKNKYKIWFLIEAHACDAMAEIGLIPLSSAKKIWEYKDYEFDIKEIDKIEKKTKHDVIAFLTHLSEIIGPDARFIHQGMTSSDILDTCFNIQLKQSSDIIIDQINNLMNILKEKAFKYKNTICIGRSHGIHAEPTTFGLKMAQGFAEVMRNKKRMLEAKNEISTGAISGAVGTFANIDPRIEKHVCSKLGLINETISTQVIPRDRHAVFFSTLGIIASCVERMSLEIRHLQRTEVLEAEEFFSEGQKGSSAMPHKRNPILSENLTGLSRLVRMSVAPSMENVSLWHERDISHSSVERNIGPDTTILVDFALNRLSNVISNLVIYPQNMLKNLNKTNGLINSQRILLSLIQKGMSREKAYEVIQRNAMKVWKEGIDFKQELKKEPLIKKVLNSDEIDSNFDNEYHLKNVDYIFNNVFGKSH